MKTLDAGHTYLLDSIDGDIQQTLTFVKREGSGYPGNVGHYPGTIVQEVLRACIDRLKYVDNQIPNMANELCLSHLRSAIFNLENRAAQRHGKKLIITRTEFNKIETLPVGKNGHLLCGAGSE